jgi:hypothetical protein
MSPAPKKTVDTAAEQDAAHAETLESTQPLAPEGTPDAPDAPATEESTEASEPSSGTHSRPSFHEGSNLAASDIDGAIHPKPQDGPNPVAVEVLRIHRDNISAAKDAGQVKLADAITYGANLLKFASTQDDIDVATGYLYTSVSALFTGGDTSVTEAE